MIREPNDLGPHLYDFAVISDTHVNPDETTCNSPFPVNARANARFRHVIADLNQRDVSFVVHLGDLLHPVPDTGPLYAQAAATYREIEQDLKVPIHHVPGNHDIGDTPVKGAPASPSTESMITAWTQEFGAQYQAFTHGNVRFLLLNAQLINSGLPDEQRQKDWVETELAQAQSRVMVMLHHPAYLCFPDEPSHYDNTDPPGRDWLLGLLEQHKVEAMFSGHAHNFWYDRFGQTDYYLAPATSFVRQDYSEMLRTCPPAGSEAGRDDKAKLGYFIVSVYDNGHTTQFVRTNGQELPLGKTPTAAKPIAQTPRENSAPRLGFDLRQNWAEISEIPPSGGLDEFDRKQARNDYPLLALIEMGVRDVRVPFSDLRDPMRRQRLSALCHLGFRPTLFSFGIPTELDLKLIETCKDCLTDWEMTLDWGTHTSLRDAITDAHHRTGLPILLSRMRSKKDLPAGSLYFHVINHGFSHDDDAQLDQLANLTPAGVAGAVFRLSNQAPIADTLTHIARATKARNMRGAVHMRVAGDNPAIAHENHTETCDRLGEAVRLLPTLESIRLWCDTFVDIDRGYFPRQGAIDRNGNPNPLARMIKELHLKAGTLNAS